MITPRLISISSPDLNADQLPSDPGKCQVFVQAEIGPSEGEGGELFDFLVVTPRFLVEEGTVRWGRGVLLMNEFSWATAQRMVQRLLAQASRASWAEVAAELNKELLWEFDNFQPHQGNRAV